MTGTDLILHVSFENGLEVNTEKTKQETKYWIVWTR